MNILRGFFDTSTDPVFLESSQWGELKIIKTFNDKTLDQNIICACAEYKIKLKVRLSNSFDFYCVGVSEHLEIVHGPQDMIYFLKAMTNNFQTWISKVYFSKLSGCSSDIQASVAFVIDTTQWVLFARSCKRTSESHNLSKRTWHGSEWTTHRTPNARLPQRTWHDVRQIPHSWSRLYVVG